MHDLVGSKPAQRGSAELHRPALRSIKARDAIEEGRLARAIRPDQRRDAPGFYLEAALREGSDPTERLPHRADHQIRVGFRDRWGRTTPLIHGSTHPAASAIEAWGSTGR